MRTKHPNTNRRQHSDWYGKSRRLRSRANPNLEGAQARGNRQNHVLSLPALLARERKSRFRKKQPNMPHWKPLPRHAQQQQRIKKIRRHSKELSCQTDSEELSGRLQEALRPTPRSCPDPLAGAGYPAPPAAAAPYRWTPLPPSPPPPLSALRPSSASSPAAAAAAAVAAPRVCPCPRPSFPPPCPRPPCR